MGTLTNNAYALIVIAALIVVYVLAGPALNIIDTEGRDDIITAIVGFLGGTGTGYLVRRGPTE